MPSSKNSSQRSKASQQVSTQSHKFAGHVFVPIILLVFIVWSLYRSIFDFPVWFDEIIGKAIFFGFPVWIFIAMTGYTGVADSLKVGLFKVGLLRGLAFGGLFGFAATLASLISQSRSIIAAPLFSSGAFWSEFGLAVMTGFWESLFFFGFIMTVLGSLKPKWSILKHVLIVAGIFTIFHIPNIFAQFAGYGSIIGYIFLVGVFGFGQAFIFSRERNLYTLVVVHAIWGMTLLIHTL
jgi:membrane protease YdiL (CAAX protease family)